MDISDIFPTTTFYQGDSWDILISLPSNPPPAWNISYVFKTVGSASIKITSAPSSDGTKHELKVSSSTTAAYTPGNFQVVCYTTCIADGERYTLGTSNITILPDLTVAINGYDPRSQNKIILDEINAALTACLGDAIQEYTIGGRTVKKNKTELLKMKIHYAMLVRQENGLQQGATIQYGFAAPSNWWLY